MILLFRVLSLVSKISAVGLIYISEHLALISSSPPIAIPHPLQESTHSARYQREYGESLICGERASDSVASLKENMVSMKSNVLKLKSRCILPRLIYMFLFPSNVLSRLTYSNVLLLTKLQKCQNVLTAPSVMPP